MPNVIREDELKFIPTGRALSSTGVGNAQRIALPSAVGPCLFDWSPGGSWLLTSYLAREVKQLCQEINSLEQEKKEVMGTLSAMQNKSWGLTLHSDQNGRFIVLPLGSKASTGWTMGKQTAIKVE